MIATNLSSSEKIKQLMACLVSLPRSIRITLNRMRLTRVAGIAAIAVIAVFAVFAGIAMAAIIAGFVEAVMIA